jgi:hypothetical protein
MADDILRNQLKGLFSGLEDSTTSDQEVRPDEGITAEEQKSKEAEEISPLLPASPAPMYLPPMPAEASGQPGLGINRRLIVWTILSLGLLAVVLLVAMPGLQARLLGENLVSVSGLQSALGPSQQPTAQATPHSSAPPTLTLPPTPTLAETPPDASFVIIGPTPTPPPVPGGWVVVLTPAPGDAGWVAGDETTFIVPVGEQVNHFGDSFLYAGILNGKIYHAAIQFNLNEIPRGTKIYAASLRLTGLRADDLYPDASATWRLQLLAPDIDARWRSHTFSQIHQAPTWSTFEPMLTPDELSVGGVQLFEFTPEQLALLERRLLEGSDQFGKKVSFRLDGPDKGGDNLFAWDTGSGVASKGSGPELFLSLGPVPEAPPPYYIVVTSTPTPENIMTAVANSLQVTAEARRVGTATPLPPNWVTPVVVTATPTPANSATAEAMNELATAMALTTGEPPNRATATTTPTYVIITSTPTAQTIATAAAISLWQTAQATRVGTATPLPPNWVTPLVVTSTSTPENAATLEYWRAVALTTGTPTPLPANAQTATPTPVAIALEGLLPTPLPTLTPTPTPNIIPGELVGKIAFLSDRAYHINANTQLAPGETVYPIGKPLAYVVNPDGSGLALLSERWPYDLALARDAYSADQRFRVYVKDAGPKSRPALFVLDSLYASEQQLTHFGAGIAYDPSWSPVADMVAFASNDSQNDEIWTINGDGSGERQLTRNGWEWDKHPSWSPDGRQIVFFSNRTGNNQIWIMNTDGSEQRPLMEQQPYNDWDPVWIKYTDPVPSQISNVK